MAEALQILEYPNVLHWYAQNCDGPGFLGRMSPIPIGIDFHTIAARSHWGEDRSSPEEQEQTLKSIRREFRPVADRLRRAYVDFAWQPANTYAPPKRHRVLAPLPASGCSVCQS